MDMEMYIARQMRWGALVVGLLVVFDGGMGCSLSPSIEERVGRKIHC